MTAIVVPAVRRSVQTYSAYGLRIRSSIVLPEFMLATGSKGDVSIHCEHGPESEWTAQVRDREHVLEIEGQEARFYFSPVGTAIVRFGTEIVITPNKDDVDESLLRLYVQGMLMAMILHQRGSCVLHASVIELQGGAIGCMGHIGAGKSSVAAALYARGNRILADDNAAVQFSGDTPMVQPAYPFVKLFPAIATSLGFDCKDLHVLHESQAKVAGAVKTGFSSQPVPLQALYILGRDHAPEITRLSALEATIHLIRNSVPTRWAHAGDARQLRQCADLAKRLPVFALRTFRELGELRHVVDQVESHQHFTLPRARAAAPLYAVSGEFS